MSPLVSSGRSNDIIDPRHPVVLIRRNGGPADLDGESPRVEEAQRHVTGRKATNASELLVPAIGEAHAWTHVSIPFGAQCRDVR